jgi:hypothetical protein
LRAKSSGLRGLGFRFVNSGLRVIGSEFIVYQVLDFRFKKYTVLCLGHRAINSRTGLRFRV